MQRMKLREAIASHHSKFSSLFVVDCCGKNVQNLSEINVLPQLASFCFGLYTQNYTIIGHNVIDNGD